MIAPAALPGNRPARRPTLVAPRRGIRAIIAACCLALAACAHLGGERGETPCMVEEGTASWYGDDFHGRPTSTGERYSMYALTAASKTIPLGSGARVTRLDNGRSVVVEVNDRGPFIGDRILDLSYGAAIRLDMLEEGLAPVRIEVLEMPGGSAVAAAKPGRPSAAAPAAPVRVSAVGTPPESVTVPAAPGPARLSLGVFALERSARWVERQVAPRFAGTSVEEIALGSAVAWRVTLESGGDAEETIRELAEMGLRASRIP